MVGVWFVAGAILAGNLVPNGDFSQADPNDPRKPAHWDLPDGLGVQWQDKAVRMDTSVSELRMNEQWTKMGLTNTWWVTKAAGNAIADTYGLSFYSDPIPVKSGQAYRVSFDYRGPSGGGKVWVRCYGQGRGEKRRLYEKVVFCEEKARGEEWVHYATAFFPTKFRPAVTEMRVMLYAYYPSGIYCFDNVKIEPVSTAEYEREKKEISER